MQNTPENALKFLNQETADKFVYSYPEIMVKYASQTSNWISVEERLPTKEDANKDGYVLAWDKYYKIPYAQRFEDLHKHLQIRFTHWQPLPSPPKID